MSEEFSPRTVLLDASGRPHVPVQRFRLRVTTGADAGAVFVSAGARASVGTHETNDLQLRDDTVSRFHCDFAIQGDDVVVTDLRSRNGTRVDGVTVLAARLHDGAQLTLGRTGLRFDLCADKVAVPVAASDRFGLLRGTSVAMRAIFAVLERAAQTDATVLLTGETGTGKDLAAESLHRESARRDGPFVVLDCGAIPAALLESELFGHERGAFTGATTDRAGAIEAANGGTLFLDEIGELAPDLQPKLLRTIDTRTVQRVGSVQRVPVDVRLVAATNRDLKVEVNTRRFRPDLFYRLAVLQVTLPPLRERLEDLPLLVDHLLAQLDPAGASVARVRDPAHLQALAAHGWPGNVRELRNYLERCVALGDERPPSLEPDAGALPVVEADLPLRVARERWVAHFERRYLDELLRRHGGNVSAAARAAGVDRVHLYRLLSRHGVRR